MILYVWILWSASRATEYIFRLVYARYYGMQKFLRIPFGFARSACHAHYINANRMSLKPLDASCTIDPAPAEDNEEVY